MKTMKFVDSGINRRVSLLCLMLFIAFGQSEFATAVEWRRPVLEVFIRADGEPSRESRTFIEKTYGDRAGLSIVYRDVTTNDKELARFWKLADHFKITKPRLPAFYVSGRFESGWNAALTPVRLEELLTVEVFTRQGCPRCTEAKPVLFQTLAHRYPAYRFIEQDVGVAEQARKRLAELSQRYQVQATSVPAVHLCGRLMVGFTDAVTSLQQWDDVLRAVTIPAPAGQESPQPVSCRWKSGRSIAGGGHWFQSTVFAGDPPTVPRRSIEVPPQDEADEVIPRPLVLPPESDDDAGLPVLPSDGKAAPPEIVVIPLLGSIHWRDWGFPAFTLAVGLIDGFNPCAMWVLLFLLSMLVNLHDRWKILAVAGTFVFISGAAYYAFMAAWLSIFELIGLLRPAQITLGLVGMVVGAVHVKDFFAFKRGVSLSIPETAKPGLYARIRQIVMAKSLWSAIIGAAIVAVLVNIIELLCTAGLPAMYTSILSSQQLPWWNDHLYMLLYILAYMFDDTLMVAGVVITLDKFKLQERGGRILKLVSGVVIIVLGSVMVLKPEWLV